MSNNYFRFKQFVIHQDRCAMKVGTDGVLLGAYTPVAGVNSILDIGTGTGVVALMLAQRSSAYITAIEIDHDAVLQASDNVNESPWKDRINVVHADFLNYSVTEKFDCIVTNPPFFQNDLKCPEYKRNIARHADTLSFESLLKGVYCLLHPNGKFVIILPYLMTSDFIVKAASYGLYLSDRLDVCPRENMPPKRSILVFVLFKTTGMVDTIVVEKANRIYSDRFIDLMREYYLYL